MKYVKGKSSWNKGKPWSKESKEKMSVAHKGKRISIGTEFKKGFTPWNKGKKGVMAIPWNKGKKNIYSEKTIEKMSKSATGKKRFFSIEHRQKLSLANKGNKSYLWKGGISKESRIKRVGLKYKLWREAVFKRDNWTCQKTNKKGGKLEAHHILNFSSHPELMYDINNGITLSKKSHTEFHNRYERENNTREQIEEFLNEDKETYYICGRHQTSGNTECCAFCLQEFLDSLKYQPFYKEYTIED